MGTRKERREGTIGQRIAFRWSERGTPNEQLRVDIAQSVSQIQLLLLVIWLLLWFSLEAVVLYFWTQEPAEGNASVGYAIYSAFWAFFASAASALRCASCSA